MSLQKTLSIIKPDAVSKQLIGPIYTRFAEAGLAIIAAKLCRLTLGEAESFYTIHKERPFFKDLVAFMSSGPIMVQVLEANDAVAKYRELMGATNPVEAKEGTLRKDFAENIDHNAVHGSDSLDNAVTEIDFFFNANELCSR